MASETILVVEDNPDDVFFLQRALKKAQISNAVQVVVDGQEAIEYLAGAEKYVNRHDFPLPYLVLLDLKLPRFDGFEVLAWMRQQPEVAAIPVVILSSSSEERDRKRTAELGVLAYLVKPPDGAMMRQLFQSLAASKSCFSSAVGAPAQFQGGTALGIT